MQSVVEMKCPECGAPLNLQTGTSSVICTYCGAQSAVGGRGAAGGQAESVPQLVPPSELRQVVAAARASQSTSSYTSSIVTVLIILISVAAPFVLGGNFIDNFIHKQFGSATSGSDGAQAGVSGKEVRFTDVPLLADVNGDGTPDVLGITDAVGDDQWIGAYDGRNGKPLWKTGVLTKDAQRGQGLRAVLLDRVISADALGKVQAYDLRTGMPVWSAVLLDKATRICQGDGVIVVTAADERTAFDPVTGKKSQIAKKATCRAVPASNDVENGVFPTYRIVDWSDFEKYHLPEMNAIDGLKAMKALVPNGPGPRFMLGARSHGTEVAMVAAVDGTKRVLWKALVPAVEPVTTSVNVLEQQAAYAGGRLVIPYDMKDSGGGTRLTCFDGATGKRLWDIQIHRHHQVSFGMTATDSDVFYATWTKLYVFSLQTGALRFAVGSDF